MIENTQLLENRKEFERELKTYPHTITNKNIKTHYFNIKQLIETHFI